MTAQDKARICWGLEGGAGGLLLDDDAWARRDSVRRELSPDVYDARMELAMADAMTSYFVENPPPAGSLTARAFAAWAERLEDDGRGRLAKAVAREPGATG
jgi:hypothetical protein